MTIFFIDTPDRYPTNIDMRYILILQAKKSEPLSPIPKTRWGILDCVDRQINQKEKRKK